MTTEEKWTAGNQFVEILLLRRSTSLSSEEAAGEPEGKGERTTRRRSDGGGRARHEQEEQGKCKACGMNGTRSKEKQEENGKRASQIARIIFCLLTVSMLLTFNAKESGLRLLWTRSPQLEAHPHHSSSHQPVSKDTWEAAVQ